MSWHVYWCSTEIGPPSMGRTSTHICLARNIWHLKGIRALHLVTHQAANVKAESAINLLWLGVKNVVVKWAFFHDTPSCMHWDPNTEWGAKHIWVEPLASHIRFLSDKRILHWKTSLSALAVCLSMVETLLVSSWFCRSVTSIKASAVLSEFLILKRY